MKTKGLLFSSFSSHLKPIVSEEYDKYLAQASLDKIKSLIPQVDTEKNIDLLPVAFNAFVVNRVNKNGDVIDTKTAIASYKNFINKPINIEHNRKSVVGVILTAGFSEYGTDAPLEEKDVEGRTSPFNVTLGGVVWKIVDKDFARKIEESSDPTSENYSDISASWELGFKNYTIIKIDSESKNVEDGVEIEDREMIRSLSAKLKSMGGDGKLGESFIYRKPIDLVLPLGIGLTEDPAADVSGVATQKTELPSVANEEEEDGEEEEEMEKEGQKTKKSKEKGFPKGDKKKKESEEDSDEEEDEEEGEDCEDEASLVVDFKSEISSTELVVPENDSKNSNEELELISHSEINDVISDKTPFQKSTMKIETPEDLNKLVKDEALASAVTRFIADRIKEASDAYEKQKQEASAALELAKKQFEQVAAQNEKIEVSMKEMSEKLKVLEAEKLEQEKLATFGSRMAELEASFELSDEAKEVIAKQVSALASDEAFAQWKESMSIFLKPFAKKPEKAESSEAKESVASEEVVDEVVAKGEASKEVVANSTQPQSPKNKWANALKQEEVILK